MQQTFRHSRLRAFGALLGALAFTAVGGLLWNDPNATLGTRAGTVLFGLFALVFLAILMPGSGHLRLTEEGMEVKTLYRTRFYRWRDLETFGVLTVPSRRSVSRMLGGGTRLVGSNYAPLYAGARPVRIAEYEDALPDTYGQDASHLAALLNAWKVRHAPNPEGRARGPWPSDVRAPAGLRGRA